MKASQTQDRSMEVPKTPNSCPTVESGARTVNRRLFHGTEPHSQRGDILSSAPLRRTTPRPLGFEQANKRVCESRSDNFRRQMGDPLQQSVDRQSITGKNLVLDATPLRRESKYKSILGTTPSAGRLEEFSKPVPNPSVCEKRTSVLTKKQASSLDDSDHDASNEEVRPAGDLSHELLEPEIVRRTKAGAPGGTKDVSQLCVMSAETRPKLASDNICSLEVFTCPLELKDIAATTLDAVREGRFAASNVEDVISPARSAQEVELTNDCLKKLKILLVPSSLPSANLVSQNYFPKSFLQMISALNVIHPWTQSSRNSINEDVRSFEVVHRAGLAEHKRKSDCVDSLLETTKFLQEVSTENESHLPGPLHRQEKNLNHPQITSDEISNTCIPTTVNYPHKSTKSYETIACVQNLKDRLSPSSLYAAQSLEFRSIWFSKRLKMAEIADACLAQNEFLFSTLV